MVDRLDILDRVTSLRPGRIHDMDQYFGALNMCQELMSESRALCSSFDEARDIRHHKTAALRQIHYAQDRVQSREVIVGDLGLGVADHGQKCGFADIGEAHKADIRDHFEFQLQLQCLRGLPGLRIARRLHGRCRVVLVAIAAAAAL